MVNMGEHVVNQGEQMVNHGEHLVNMGELDMQVMKAKIIEEMTLEEVAQVLANKIRERDLGAKGLEGIQIMKARIHFMLKEEDEDKEILLKKTA